MDKQRQNNKTSKFTQNDRDKLIYHPQQPDELLIRARDQSDSPGKIIAPNEISIEMQAAKIEQNNDESFEVGVSSLTAKKFDLDRQY